MFISNNAQLSTGKSWWDEECEVILFNDDDFFVLIKGELVDCITPYSRVQKGLSLLTLFKSLEEE